MKLPCSALFYIKFIQILLPENTSKTNVSLVFSESLNWKHFSEMG